MPSPRASRGRTARRGSAGRRRRTPRSRRGPRRGRRGRRGGSRRGPRAPRGAARRRRTSACPRRAARTRVRGGGRSCARVSPPRQRNAVPSPLQPSSSRAASTRRAARSARGRRRSRSPRSCRARPEERPRAGRAASCDTAMTVAARLTTCRVAARTPGLEPTFATSWPCAVTTSGARVASAAGEARGDEEVRVGDIGIEPPRRAGGVAEEPKVAPPASGARVDDRTLDLVTALDAARARGSRRRPRGPDRPDPDTSARRGGFAAALPARDLQDPEAHLVGRALAPEDVAGRLRHARAPLLRACPRRAGT